MDKFDLFLLIQKPIINGYILSKITADGKFYFARDAALGPTKTGKKKTTTNKTADKKLAQVTPVQVFLWITLHRSDLCNYLCN